MPDAVQPSTKSGNVFKAIDSLSRDEPGSPAGKPHLRATEALPAVRSPRAAWPHEDVTTRL